MNTTQSSLSSRSRLAPRASSARASGQRRRSRLATVRQLLGAFRGTGRWWLTPLVVVLLVVAAVLVVVQVVQYAAPFVYTLF